MIKICGRIVSVKKDKKTSSNDWIYLRFRVNMYTTKAKKNNTMTTAEILTKIAQEHLDIETLEQRWSDNLDFYDCSVWGIKSALEAAFEAGKNSK